MTSPLSEMRLFLFAAAALAAAASTTCPAAGLVWPPITEPATSRYTPGKWVWAELFSENVEAATRFYAAAYGWSFQRFAAPHGPGYTLALSDGEPVGGMVQREQTYQQQRGSRWLGMISVPDVRAAVHYAASLFKGLTLGFGTVLTALPQGAAAGYGSYIVGQAARYYFQHGASWGEAAPKTIVTQILANTDKQSILKRLKEEIKKKISLNPYAGGGRGG